MRKKKMYLLAMLAVPLRLSGEGRVGGASETVINLLSDSMKKEHEAVTAPCGCSLLPLSYHLPIFISLFFPLHRHLFSSVSVTSTSNFLLC